MRGHASVLGARPIGDKYVVSIWIYPNAANKVLKIRKFFFKTFLLCFSPETKIEDFQVRAMRQLRNWYPANAYFTKFLLRETEDSLSAIWCCSFLPTPQLQVLSLCFAFAQTKTSNIERKVAPSIFFSETKEIKYPTVGDCNNI